MHSNLKVKNFGPIKDADVQLKNVNVFIGHQASGKSVLAKLFTIVKAPRKFLKGDFTVPNPEISYNYEKSLSLILEEYNIDSFLQDDTQISFVSDLHTFAYSGSKITYTPKLLHKIFHLENLLLRFDENKDEIKNSFKDLSEKFININFRVRKELFGDHKWRMQDEPQYENLTEEMSRHILDKTREVETALSTNAALYIPAERNLSNIIKEAALNLQINNVPIPKHLLTFGAELEKSRQESLNLDFISQNLVYKNLGGKELIFTDDFTSIKLSQAASGIQSVIPIIIPIVAHSYKKFTGGHRSFVIEEPELNLFPSAQYGLIKHLESGRSEHYWEDFGEIHTYTTHSPYVLSALNNLLMANKILRQQKNQEDKDKVIAITKAQINPYYFTAYQIKNGTAISIFSPDSGLIEENFIDEASDELADDFDNLMKMMK